MLTLKCGVEILHTCRNLVVISKPSGLLTKRAFESVEDNNAFDICKEHFGTLYLCHRIDRPVSGVLAFARNSKTARALMKSWQAKEVDKSYLAIVQGHPKMKQKMLKNVFKGRDVQLEYTTLFSWTESSRRMSLLKVKTFTGTKHQIRKQLSNAGHVIIGDHKYSSIYSSIDFADDTVALHAWTLRLPVNKEFQFFSAPIPTLWEQFLPSEAVQKIKI